ncbi:MAG: hypothetical protein ACXVCS_13835 [Bdellovibrionota bacterium]
MNRPDNAYFVNPAVDAFFVGGASILCFLFFRVAFTGYGATQVSDLSLTLATVFSWIGNWPHFSATNYRLYESRANVRQFRLTAVLIPVVIAIATAACFVYPVSFAPYFVKLFILWSPYHFSAQTLGITLIYARRCELRISPLARRALAGFFFSSFLVAYATTENTLSTGFIYAMTYPNLRLPQSTPLVFEVAMYASLAVLAYEVLPALHTSKRFPWIFFLPIVTQFLWFVYGAENLSFQLLVPFFHALQYLLIAWSIHIHSRGTATLFQHLFGSARWFAGNVLIGGFLFFGLPHLLALRGWPLDYAVVIIAAGVSLHHYFVDGVIWKLKQERSQSPLFLNVGWALRGTE